MADNLQEYDEEGVKKFRVFVEGKSKTENIAEELWAIIENFETSIVEQSTKISQESQQKLYYYIIKSLIDGMKHDVSCITTNYTSIAQRITRLSNDKFAYLHGRLSLFEELETKYIDDVKRVNCENTVFPYLLVQSGVKPIISAHQIEEFRKAYEMIDGADHLLILGYGINPDDEHITNFLRDRLRKGKSVKVFLYFEQKTEEQWNGKVQFVQNQLGFEHLLEFYDADEFSKIIEKL
jgi:hypothetical protein